MMGNIIEGRDSDEQPDPTWRSEELGSVTLNTNLVNFALSEYLRALIALNVRDQTTAPLLARVEQLAADSTIDSIVVVGSPGNGKTTLTQALVRMWIREARKKQKELDVFFVFYDLVHKFLTSEYGDDGAWSPAVWLMISDVFDEWVSAAEAESLAPSLSRLLVEEFPRIKSAGINKDRGFAHLQGKIAHRQARAQTQVEIASDITALSKKMIVFVVVAPNHLRETNKQKRKNILAMVDQLNERRVTHSMGWRSVKLTLDDIFAANGLNFDYDAVYQAAFAEYQLTAEEQQLEANTQAQIKKEKEQENLDDLFTLLITIFGSMASTEFIDSVWLESVAEAEQGLQEIRAQYEADDNVKELFATNNLGDVDEILRFILMSMNVATKVDGNSDENMDAAKVMTYQFLTLLLQGQPYDQIVLAFNMTFNNPIITQMLTTFKHTYQK